jgi:hypothetical protein
VYQHVPFARPQQPSSKGRELPSEGQHVDAFNASRLCLFRTSEWRADASDASATDPGTSAGELSRNVRSFPVEVDLSEIRFDSVRFVIILMLLAGLLTLRLKALIAKMSVTLACRRRLLEAGVSAAVGTVAWRAEDISHPDQ